MDPNGLDPQNGAQLVSVLLASVLTFSLKKVVPVIPRDALPLLCSALGVAAFYGTSLLSSQLGMPIVLNVEDILVAGGIAGLGGIGLRENVNRVTKAKVEDAPPDA